MEYIIVQFLGFSGPKLFASSLAVWRECVILSNGAAEVHSAYYFMLILEQPQHLPIVSSTV